jgi:dUTP pyrophosphatase
MPTVEFLPISDVAERPHYATAGSACFDLRSVEDCTILPGKVKAVSLGFAVSIPEGYEMQIRSRSGLASKGVMVANGIGTIDSDYRGEVKVLLFNSTEETIEISAGDRIAQGIVCPVLRTEFVRVASLVETERGKGGFGSTGTN